MSNVIWSKESCPFCVRAKHEFTKRGMEFEERKIGTNGWTKEQLLEAVPNARTVPQIFIDDLYIGGYTELVDYLDQRFKP